MTDQRVDAPIALSDIDMVKLLKMADEFAVKHLTAKGRSILENNWGVYLADKIGPGAAIGAAPEYAKFMFTLGFINGSIGKHR